MITNLFKIEPKPSIYSGAWSTMVGEILWSETWTFEELMKCMREDQGIDTHMATDYTYARGIITYYGEDDYHRLTDSLFTQNSNILYQNGDFVLYSYIDRFTWSAGNE